jgi:spore germination protein YaaH
MRSLLSYILAWLVAALIPACVWAAEPTFCSASYITEKIRGEDSIDQFGSNFQSINVFAYEFTPDGVLKTKGAWVPEMAATLRGDPGRLILIDVVNDIRPGRGTYRDATPGQMVHAILSDPAKRAQHIRELVAIAALAQGLEIDYEHLLAETKPYYTQFLRELRRALPGDKRLAIVIQPKFDNAPGPLGRAIDWRAVEPYVDWIRLMAYYYSWGTSPPGPVVSYAQLRRLALYSMNDPQQSIPRSKARILLSFYGWDWPVNPAGKGHLVQYHEAVALAERYGVTPVRDPASDVLHFQYRERGVLHEVWFDDELSLRKRIELLADVNYPHIDFWHLGTGNESLWRWISEHTSRTCPDLRPPARPASALQIEKLDPPSARQETTSLDLIVTGVGFSSSTVLLYHGSPRFPASASSTTLRVPLPSTDFDSPGVRQIMVSDGYQVSAPVPFYVVGKPVLKQLSPDTIAAGSDPFTLTVRGEGFGPGSELRWNGRALQTRFVSDSELSIQIAASDIAQPETIQVTVMNGASGLESTPLPFRVGAFAFLSGGLSGAVVSPNPWTADVHQGKPVRFTGLTPGAQVRIFTMSARHVKSLSGSSGLATWDLTNDDGKAVASGYYLYVVTDPHGNKARGKLAVVR